MKVAYSEADITPQVGTAMCAFPRGPEKAPRTAEDIHDPLKVRALLLDDGDNTVAIVACDLLLWQTADVVEIKAKAQELSKGKIAADNIMLCSTHTHSGFENTYLFGGKPDAPQIISAKNAVVQTICRALKTFVDAELFFAQVDAPFSHNRRVIENNKLILACNRNEHTTGATDSTLSLLRCERANGKSLFWINWTAHALTLGPKNSAFSADYPGALISKIKERFSNSETIFTNGCAGNIHPFKSMQATDIATDEIAGLLTEKVQQANTAASRLPVSKLLFNQAELLLPHRSDSAVKVKVPLACLTLGSLKIGFLPGEPFVELQLRYRKAMHPNYAFVNGYSNGWIGYIPTAAAFEEGGYGVELYHDPNPLFGRTQICPGAGELIIEKLIKLSTETPREKYE